MEIKNPKKLAGEEKIDVCLQKFLKEGFIDSYRRVNVEDCIDREIDALGVDFYIYKKKKKKYPAHIQFTSATCG